jgi:drug/metabolite transporter (DMT)-like permease
VTYLLPGVGLIWGAVVLEEPVTWGMIVGLGTVLASVALVNEVRIGSQLAPLEARGSVS